MTENVKDIIEYIKANGISDEDWQKMYDVAVEFDKNRSEEEKRRELLEEVRKLYILYKTDKHFQMWCEKIKDIEEYQCALENFEIEYAKSHGGSYYPDWSDVPGEDIYIPCFTRSSIKNNGNPYLYDYWSFKSILVRHDIDDLIVIKNEYTGSKAFAAFWLCTFNTVHMPEIVYDEDHKEPIYNNSNMEDYDTQSKDPFFHVRCLVFDRTIWDKKNLKSLYKEAITGLKE